MIMPAGQERLLLPAKPRFIFMSLLICMAVHITLLLALGRAGSGWLPNIFAVVLLFWVVHQPRYIGLGAAFFCGLCVDIYHYTHLLGQHALVFVIMAAVALQMQRRLVQFSAWEQTLQIILVFIAGQIILVVLSLLTGGIWPNWSVIFKPFLETLLWPVVAWVLLAPQRRAPNPDLHRPL